MTIPDILDNINHNWAALIMVVEYLAFICGIVLVVYGSVNMLLVVRSHDSKNNKPFHNAIVPFLVGALLFNISQVGPVIGHTLYTDIMTKSYHDPEFK